MVKFHILFLPGIELYLYLIICFSKLQPFNSGWQICFLWLDILLSCSHNPQQIMNSLLLQVIFSWLIIPIRYLFLAWYCKPLILSRSRSVNVLKCSQWSPNIRGTQIDALETNWYWLNTFSILCAPSRPAAHVAVWLDQHMCTEYMGELLKG